jgi:tRNA(fMet)-specific endonuclease VapC
MNLRILDTDLLTLLQKRDPVVFARLASVPVNTIAISIISVEEQISGWYRRLRRAKKPKDLASAYDRLTAAVKSLSRLRILSFK